MKSLSRRSFTAHAALVAAVVFAVACSTNPVTGQREFNIVSEQQELAMGQQGHQQVLAEYGVYDEKPELNRLVTQIGQRIASESERPNLPWTFTVLDTPMVNAMALPGGYIYITRGMLERINSTDELAGVLGHEIAHVTARHAAQRISRAQLAQFGLVLGAAVAGPQAAQQYGQIAELGATLLFQRYSRAQETQADLVGTGYMAQTGFNPLGAERMLITLQRLGGNEGGSIERYFASHPDPGRRVQDVRRKVAEIQSTSPQLVSGGIQRDSFVRLLDGMMTGDSTKHVTIRNNTVYDRDHGLILQAPRGWKATTAPGAFFVVHPERGEGQYFVAQEVSQQALRGASNAQAAVRQRLQQMGLQPVTTGQVSAATGERFVVDVWRGQTQRGAVTVESTQFVHGDHVAVLMFLTPARGGGASAMGSMINNMSVDVNRARNVAPPRIRIDTARSGEGWSQVAQRATGSPADAQVVAAINGFSLNEAPPRGITLKLPQEIATDR
jgi:predicted Zn-dependent protease